MLETHKPSPLLITNKQPFIPSSTEDNYHVGSPAAVPFTWESQPGTPKVRFRRRDSTSLSPLPPLTPPPSYFYSPSPRHYNVAVTPKRFPSPSHTKPSKKKNLLDTLSLFPRRRISTSNSSSSKYSKATAAATSSSPVYSSSSSYSSTSSPTSRSVPSSPTAARWPAKHSASSHVVAGSSSCGERKSFADMLLTGNHGHHEEEEDQDECDSPVSTLCFGAGRRPNNPRARVGCYGSFMKVLINA